jgi:hypothetical protein
VVVCAYSPRAVARRLQVVSSLPTHAEPGTNAAVGLDRHHLAENRCASTFWGDPRLGCDGLAISPLDLLAPGTMAAPLRLVRLAGRLARMT